MQDFKFFWLKIYVLVGFLLNCIEDKYSRFISGEQFHLMFKVSFPVEFKSQEQSFRISAPMTDRIF